MKRFLALALAVAATAPGACGRSTQPPVAGDVSLADSADQVLFDIHYIITQQGVKRGDMYADTMFVFNDQTKFALRKVRANFSTETGVPDGTLRGDRGTYDTRTQILEGYGNVVVTSTDGKSLRSPHLKYDQTKNLVSSDSAYTMRRPRESQESRGIGFQSDPNLKRFRCLRACGGEALVPMKGIDRP